MRRFELRAECGHLNCTEPDTATWDDVPRKSAGAPRIRSRVGWGAGVGVGWVVFIRVDGKGL